MSKMIPKVGRILNNLSKRCSSYCVFRTQRRQCTTMTMMSQLEAKIRLGRPITVAEYMKTVLTNPTAGYYMHQDVFGTKGDFTTSPEISQMFGELLAVWVVSEWMQAGSPSKLQVVELGPGRGTMADDMLRAFTKFPNLKESVSLHLVEVSHKLSEMQETKLTRNQPPSKPVEDGSQPHYKSCQSKYGPEVFWYRELDHVPRGHSAFIAHEFFDALPIHKFQKTDTGWREVMVDVDPDKDHQLRFVLSPAKTPATVAYLQVGEMEKRDHIEVCPAGGVVVQAIASRIHRDGGSALIADYGHYGVKGDTFRGFRDHKLHDVLIEPGTADLTADVDFSYLQKMAGDKVCCHGPITQADFLMNMGIGVRLQMLLRSSNIDTQKDLISGFKMLTHPDQMGECFKFFAMLANSRTDKPAGFVAPM